MQHDNPHTVDKRLARRAFEASSGRYDRVAVLQREVGQRLLERLELMKLAPSTVLDVGCGTGFCTRALVRRYPRARVLALDIAHAMVAATRARAGWWQRLRGRYGFVCADAEALPLADASVDLVFSNLTLQWCPDLEASFREFRRVLVPGGLLLFTSFGPDTLRELRDSWAQADGHTHVNAFIDMHDVGDALLRARFEHPVMDMEYLTVTYPQVQDLMRDLKHLGAHNVTQGRPRGLTGKGRLRAMHAAYESYRTEGVLPATYELVYGHAWVPTEAPEPRARGSAISLDALRATARRRPGS